MRFGMCLVVRALLAVAAGLSEGNHSRIGTAGFVSDPDYGSFQHCDVASGGRGKVPLSLGGRAGQPSLRAADLFTLHPAVWPPSGNRHSWLFGWACRSHGTRPDVSWAFFPRGVEDSRS